ncbi:MAG: outer membrane lipoprotein carrier protein LolA [Treponema sp.]|nr:outer membrane lipoprotein carrier protein LolA [Treponema sp.]
MKKIVNVAMALFFLSVMAFAQTTTFETVCARLAAHPNTTGDFTQVRRIVKANRSLASSGTFIFSLDGIMWKTLKPFPSSLVVGMTSVIQTTPDGKKTVIDASNNQIFTSISTTLSSVFSGNVQKLYESFSVDFSASANTWKATLTPKDKTVAAVMQSLELGGTTTQTGAEFSTIVMTDANGDTTTYTFTNQKYPKELSPEEKAVFAAK